MKLKPGKLYQLKRWDYFRLNEEDKEICLEEETIVMFLEQEQGKKLFPIEHYWFLDPKGRRIRGNYTNGLLGRYFKEVDGA